MSKSPKVLVLAGSLRKGSTNKKLAKIAASSAIKAGADVTYIDLKDYPLPIYDGDIEDSEGLPQNAIKLKELMFQTDGFIFVSPEYNSSISAALKNMIDWTSRKATTEEVYLSCFIDKMALILSASPSPMGGLRGLVHLRSILENIFTFVLPKQKVIPDSWNAFDDKGNLSNPKDQKEVEGLAELLVKTIQKMKQ
ncbi:MAG: NAD(P)H-dependent oxidoreductase [Rhabdochlamydiaceae bacterium]|nr:NAD(P)H-dependent oxidoreductase [Rhabdochlamydiaceae bacterium]